MKFCLYEALVNVDRQFLSEATIGLIRDERSNKLLIKFVACNSELEFRSGLLFQVKALQGMSGRLGPLSWTHLVPGLWFKFPP